MADQGCKNCEAPLLGRFCHCCGQKVTPVIPSVSSLLGDVTASFMHADSRLWRTLKLLLFKPGELPKRYFAGQRTHFLPPIRLYLTLSLLFFMAISLSSNRGFVEQSTLVPPSTETRSDAGDLGDMADLDAVVSELRCVEGVGNGSADADCLRHAGEAVKNDIAGRVATSPSLSDQLGDCGSIGYTGPAEAYIKERLRLACETALVDNGRGLAREFLGYLPTAAFLMMPFFALAMKAFYWRPRRFFIEHFVFQVLNHSAFFLIGLIAQFVTWVSGLVTLPGAGFVEFALLLYVLYYCYRSLRVYYQQTRWVSWAKFVGLGTVYLSLLVGDFLLVGLITVF